MIPKTQQTSIKLFNRLYDSLPAFTDVFDEETFYIFAGLTAATSVVLAIVLSRFITLRECDW